MPSHNPASTREELRKQSLLRSHNPLIIIVFLVALGMAMTQAGCVSLTGNMSVSQSSLNFGKVPLGSSGTQAVTLSNTAGVPLTITSVAATGGPFTVSGPELPLALSQGQSAIFTARFAPPKIGEDSGSLLITESQSSTTQLSGSSGSATPSVIMQMKTISMAGTGVSAAPSITTQPASEDVSAGHTVTFSVTSSGVAPLSYQWSKNGTPIPGATSADYTTPAATASDNGAQFTVEVSNSAGNARSNAAVLTVGAGGQLVASTTKLSYGNVTVGASSVLPVMLTNSGSASISISNVSLSGAGVSAAGASSGLILSAGNSAVLNVTFAPSAAGTLNGSVTVTSNAGDPTVTIALAGTAMQSQHSVTLSLTPDSSNVTGYNVYRSSTSSGPYTKLNSPLLSTTTYTDSTVVAAKTYFYVGTSVDSAGNETAYSNQVSATVPSQ